MKPIIFVLDDDRMILELITNQIIESELNCDLHCFDTYSDLLKHPDIERVSLFIIDIRLQHSIDGRDVCLDILTRQPLNTSTFLFTSGFSYSYESFEDLTCTYDYIDKPFQLKNLIQRIKLLLKVSEEYRKQCAKKKNLEISVWDIFNYSNIYLVILDPEMKVKLCSYMLAKDLGYPNEESIIGTNWINFIPFQNQPQIKFMYKEILSTTQNQYGQVTYEILTKDEKVSPVKWFNAIINNGIKLSFSIGIPLTKKITTHDDLDSLRDYWTQIIEKDKTTINTLRDMIRRNESLNTIEFRSSEGM